jgi:hypothetical protein
MWYICHVRDTAGHSGPGTFARGCRVRQYTTHASKYTATATPTLSNEGKENGIESSSPMVYRLKTEDCESRTGLDYTRESADATRYNAIG